MENRNIILLFCLFAASVVAWNNPRSFQGTGTYVYNGKSFTGAQVWYDYNAKRLAIRVNYPDSSNMLELFHFDTKQRFQQCSFTQNCLNTVWNQQQWVWFVDSADGGVAETVNGVPCYRFNVPQTDGWTATLWFAQTADTQGNNLLVRANMAKSGETRSFTLNTATYPVSSPPFTPSNTCGATTCYAQLDLMLVLDDSDSISDSSWTQAIGFAINVVNSFPRISNNDVRIGVVTFSTTPVLQIGLNPDRTAIINKLNTIVRQRAETGISLGISTAQSQLTNNGRVGVNKAMIVLTDGVPNVPPPASLASNETKNQATLARNAGSIIYAIGVGAQTNIQTLYLMASTPYTDFVSLVGSFSDLNSIQDTLVKSVCPGGGTDTCNCNGNRGMCACGQCKCTSGCGTNGVQNADCSCTCTAPWTLDSNGGCTQCDATAAAQLRCNGRGTITNLQTCDGCSCTAPWTGADCSQCGITDCVHGTLNSGTCSCTCDANWTKDSSGRCTVCSYTCRNGGVPVATCDSCTCPAPWTGTDCSTCGRAPGYCQNGGSLVQNTCLCQCTNSWGSADCSVCNFNCNNRGTRNPSCNGCTCNDCIRGTNNANCLCTCPTYWTRAPNGTCTVCDNATANTNICSGRGTIQADCATCNCNNCSNGGTVNATNCQCACQAPWTYNTNTKDCTTCSNTRASLCNNRGNVNSTCNGCTCDANWGGVNCGTCTATSAICSNGGTIITSSCTCQCSGNWGGNLCQTCNLNCNGRGTADPTCTTCNCQAPWTGTNCLTCGRDQTFCTRGTIDLGTCACTCPAGTGWTGANCATCSWTGANRCNGRGTINTDCQTCNCTAPWTGTQCQTCGLTQAFCGAHGTLNTGSCTCTCDAGWGGAQCNTCQRTDTYCNSPKGRIDNTTCGCICNAPWTGATCDQCVRPPNYCQNGGSVSADCMTCTCPGGFTGQFCQSCDLAQNCGNGFLNASTCSCQCIGGWSGARCQTCPNNSGQCGVYSTWNQSSCACNCDPDYNWSGTLCTTCNINCNQGVSLVQIGVSLCDCLCYGAYAGEFCDNCTLTDTNCGNGHARRSDCSCVCNSGWTGEACGRCSLIDTGCPSGLTLNATSCQCLCPTDGATPECCARISDCNGCNNANGCKWCEGRCLLEAATLELNCSTCLTTSTGEIAEASSSEEGTNNIPAIVGGAVGASILLGGLGAAVAVYRFKKTGKKLNIGKRLSKVFGNVTDNPLYKQAAIEGNNPMFESGHKAVL